MTQPRLIAPHLVLVGGFLGAGKTTLILAAARLLEAQGLRCAVILNDQSDSLVDTRLAEHRGVAFDEVTGGCFCCRFNDLLDAADRLAAYDPDVIFAEPVGSCTDIVATPAAPTAVPGPLPHRPVYGPGRPCPRHGFIQPGYLLPV